MLSDMYNYHLPVISSQQIMVHECDWGVNSVTGCSIWIFHHNVMNHLFIRKSAWNDYLFVAFISIADSAKSNPGSHGLRDFDCVFSEQPEMFTNNIIITLIYSCLLQILFSLLCFQWLKLNKSSACYPIQIIQSIFTFSLLILIKSAEGLVGPSGVMLEGEVYNLAPQGHSVFVFYFLKGTVSAV